MKSAVVSSLIELQEEEGSSGLKKTPCGSNVTTLQLAAGNKNVSHVAHDVVDDNDDDDDDEEAEVEQEKAEDLLTLTCGDSTLRATRLSGQMIQQSHDVTELERVAEGLQTVNRLIVQMIYCSLCLHVLLTAAVQ